VKLLAIKPLVTLCFFAGFAFSQQFSTILDFQAGVTRTTLVAGANGVLYGEGDSSGVFALLPPSSPGGAWTESTVYSSQETYDFPIAIGPKGELYGSEMYPTYCDVFQLTPPSAPGGNWTETVIYTLTPGVGGIELAVAGDGTVYGATEFGGATSCGGPLPDFGCGMIFALTPPSTPGGTWSESAVYNFAGPPDGEGPTGLTVSPDGTIYGTVQQGGSYNIGAVFALTPPTVAGGAWTEQLLHSFTGKPDGATPTGGVTIAGDGSLYGVTLLGGTAKRGTVFRLKPPAGPGGRWNEAVLYSFQGPPDGWVPSAGLAIGPAGSICGATVQGGIVQPECKKGCGTVYELSAPSVAGGAWTEKVVNAFAGGRGGVLPYGGLVTGSDGNIYGTTSDGGGPNGNGTAFQIQP
jgi:uncharacterized repeat protein (TIGR03803 family)